MDKGVAPCSPSSRHVVLPVAVGAHKWSHGSLNGSEMPVDALQKLRCCNKYLRVLVQALEHPPSVWWTCGVGWAWCIFLVQERISSNPWTSEGVHEVLSVAMEAHTSRYTPYVCQCSPQGSGSYIGRPNMNGNHLWSCIRSNVPPRLPVQPVIRIIM